MKIYKFSNSTDFGNQDVPSEYHSKLGSNVRKLGENIQGLLTEACPKISKPKTRWYVWYTPITIILHRKVFANISNLYCPAFVYFWDSDLCKNIFQDLEP